MNRNLLRTTIFLLILFYSLTINSQTQKYSLIEVLHSIEQKYNCKFSYADKDISSLKIENPSQDYSLKEVLKYLEQKTNLSYTILNDNFIAISSKPSAISICGFVKSIDNQQFLESSTIQVGEKTTITDKNGYFILHDVNEKDVVIIRFLGYKNSRQSAKYFANKPCNTVYLNPQIEYLNEVEMQGYLIKTINKTTSGSLEINFTNFEIVPGLIEADVLQTIQALPGIQSVNETVSTINIRGGTHDQNLILWDGIKMYQSGHFFGLISAFNPHLTKKVTLIKNGSSAMYTNGVSGTIDMRTENEVNTQLKGGIGLNLINLDGYLDIPIGNSSLQLSARKSINEVFETPTYKQYFDKAFQDTEVVNSNNNVINSNDKFSFYDTNLRWIYDLNDYDQLSVNFMNSHNNLVFLENALINNVSESRESSVTQNNLAAGINYTRKWNKYLKTTLQFYGSNYNLTAINNDIFNAQKLIQENEVIETGLNFNSEYKITTNSTTLNGYQFSETGISNLEDVNNPIYRRYIKEVLRVHGVFSEYQYDSDNTFIKLGGRINYIEQLNHFNFEPRFAVNQSITSNLKLEILGEFKSQTTSQIIDFQNDFLGVEKRRWILSNNNDIPIIKSKQMSLGLHYNYKGWLISTEGYYKNVTGITTQSQGFQNQFQFIKTCGNYNVKGVDFLINKRFQNFSTWLSYSFSDNNYEFKDLNEINFPNNIEIKHQLTFATVYSSDNLKISAGLNWHSGKPITEPNTNNPLINNAINYNSPNSSRLANYLRFDASAMYTFQLNNRLKGQTGVSVWNFTDQKNYINSYYKLINNIPEKHQKTSLGITPNATFRIIF